MLHSDHSSFVVLPVNIKDNPYIFYAIHQRNEMSTCFLCAIESQQTVLQIDRLHSSINKVSNRFIGLI